MYTSKCDKRGNICEHAIFYQLQDDEYMQKTPCIAAEISPGTGRSRAWHEFDKTSGLRWMLDECLKTRKTKNI